MAEFNTGEALSPAATLRRLGLRPRKGLSQTFLTDQNICRTMADDAELGPDDAVLELGPGLGILTEVLVQRAGRVVAVEIDCDLAARLPMLAPDDRLQVVNGDALQFDPAVHFSADYKLIANLPYQISSPVLRRFLVEMRRPSVLVLMLQREVAERLAARPGDASFLSILVQSVGTVQIRRTVAPGAFHPRPKVTSAVVRIQPHPRAVVPDALLSPLLALVRAGFTQPRKTVANSLAQGLGIPRVEAEKMLLRGGLDASLRPQHLSIDDWVALFRAQPDR